MQGNFVSIKSGLQTKLRELLPLSWLEVRVALGKDKSTVLALPDLGCSLLVMRDLIRDLFDFLLTYAA